jgi:hypothetical protein
MSTTRTLVLLALASTGCATAPPRTTTLEANAARIADVVSSTAPRPRYRSTWTPAAGAVASARTWERVAPIEPPVGYVEEPADACALEMLKRFAGSALTGQLDLLFVLDPLLEKVTHAKARAALRDRLLDAEDSRGSVGDGEADRAFEAYEAYRRGREKLDPKGP